MTINLKLLTALNISHSDAELLQVIDFLSDSLADGTIAAVSDGDMVTSFYLTPAGKALLPTRLPSASA
jgi:hypothetical protein